MTLSHELVSRFQALHLKKFNKPITYDIAEQQLQELANLVRLTTSFEKGEQNA